MSDGEADMSRISHLSFKRLHHPRVSNRMSARRMMNMAKKGVAKCEGCGKEVKCSYPNWPEGLVITGRSKW